MLSGLVVVKVGGRTVSDAGSLAALARALLALPRAVVVHGGGDEVTALQRRLGLEPEWRDGLRVTTAASLDVVGMVLSGRINKRVVRSLLDGGVPAAGISGEDGGLLVAEPVRGGALGRVGAVVAVDPTLPRALVAAGLIPVISPVSRGTDGAPLNVNADDAAAALAGALGAERLLLVSDVPGVRADTGPVPELPELTERAAAAALASGAIDGGMAPKVRAGLMAVAGGVADVRIGDLSLLTGAAGTRLVAAGVAA